MCKLSRNLQPVKKIGLLCVVLSWAVCSPAAPSSPSLRNGFTDPPQAGKAQTWWHWTSLFVTKEGIQADLEAMKQIGYSGAHIFATSSSPCPPGDYPEILSPEWLDLVQYAGKEASRLGLTLGVHNCPGWSLSGGPWIRPEESMQMIVSSESHASGGKRQKIVLPQPETRHGYYRDIAVLAFPDVNRHDIPQLKADFKEDSLSNITDGDYTSFIRLPIAKEGSSAVVTLSYDTPYSPQFIELSFGEVHLFVKGTIEASADGKHFREVGNFDYRIRTDMRLPKCIPLNDGARNARFFRVTFNYRPYRYWMKPANVQLNEIRLLASPMVNDVDTRNSTMEDSYSYKPFDPAYTSPALDPARDTALPADLAPAGTHDCTLPQGKWTILRIGHTTTGKTNGPSHYTGLECDKLNRRGLDAHWPGMMARIEAQLKPTGALKYAIIDSYEAGGQNWTEGFDEEFLKRRGYDLKPYLPAVIGFVVGTPQQSARFLFDFQRTISELFAENYYDYFTELCHRNGLLSITESYFGPFDYLRCARNADIPTGEFWVGSGTSISRMPGSAAHFHGKARVGAESFTAGPVEGRWQQDPAQLKIYGDRAWIHGVTQLVMHSYVHQPYLNVRPGWTLAQHGSHLSRANTWWPYGNGWVDYINRSQFLLQQGTPVADLLVLSGESAPNNYPTDLQLLTAGYNYDFCCVDDLRELVQVKNGRITAPSGATYAVLSLGPDRYLTLPTLNKIYQLLQDGAAVAGLPPLGSPSLSDNDTEYAEMVRKIWGDSDTGLIQSVGKGRIIRSNDPVTILTTLNIQPDTELPEKVYGIHRCVGDTDIYFLYNDSTRTIHFNGKFRVSEDKSPEYWNAQDGTTIPAAVWRKETAGTVVTMTLQPYESLFVVFVPNKKVAPHVLDMTIAAPADEEAPTVSARVGNDRVRLFFREPATATLNLTNGKIQTETVRDVPAPVDLSDNWQVNFPADLGAPDSIRLNTLASLSESPEEGVRYFSGTATYSRTFLLPKGWNKPQRRVVLDLGTVRNLAEVKINGHKAGLLWASPFQLEISDFLQPGTNRIEIAVTNLWVNRLIGDARNTATIPETDGWPDWVLADKPNSGQGTYTFSPWKGWNKEEPLQPSGLIGPVLLRCIEIR